MSRRVFRILIILSVISIIGIITVQIVWVRKAYALRERQFRQTAFIALQDVANQVGRLNGITQSYTAVTQLSPDYFIVNTDSPVDPGILEHYIQNSLRNHHLITDFEYGIYNCESDRMIYGAFVSLNANPETVQASRNLPKFSRSPYYFGIHFPSQTSFIAGHLDGWIASSAAVLLVVLFFGYTLVVVLRQRKLTEVQRDFINNITHELQTPVATLRIAADVLQSDSIFSQPERHRQYVRVVQEESLRLQKQVSNVLQLSRSERMQFTINATEVDLHELLTEAATVFHPHVTLELRAENAVIRADRYHLENVINNLIDNALKYNTAVPHILVQTRNEGNRLLWSVQDNGIGIAREHHQVVFNQFYRVPTGNVHAVKGFGLGLYYVWKVIKAHRWQIVLESIPGVGSIFTVKVGETKKTAFLNF
ncbi:HAMP domain-containing sensor histidine kinase [Larkinella knui]|uniref:histidine kinase n=1 Tax=Larkinella knui TaxID=2025310 RepID=A0A3P1CKA5_9BACT|nr:HAMP domain-containing sensor histidine kinase [Larkinella knui]RRB13689.1 sensor histidine kinase [Larkinella knui]